MVLQIGQAQPVQDLPSTWEMVTAIAVGKHKLGEFWTARSGQASCPQLGAEKHVNNLKGDENYAMMPAKGGEDCCVLRLDQV